MKDGMDIVARRIAVHKLSSGTQVTLSSLGLQDYVSAREQALRSYRRDRLQVWTENADLMPEGKRDEWIREQFEKAEQITATDLPQKKLALPVYLPNGQMKMNGTGKPVLQDQRVEYAMWWMSDTPEGKLYMIWLSMKRSPGQETVTLDDADALFIDALGDLENAAQVVGELSETKLSGKADAPQTPEGQTRRQRRRRR